MILNSTTSSGAVAVSPTTTISVGNKQYPIEYVDRIKWVGNGVVTIGTVLDIWGIDA